MIEFTQPVFHCAACGNDTRGNLHPDEASTLCGDCFTEWLDQAKGETLEDRIASLDWCRRMWQVHRVAAHMRSIYAVNRKRETEHWIAVLAEIIAAFDMVMSMEKARAEAMSDESSGSKRTETVIPAAMIVRERWNTMIVRLDKDGPFYMRMGDLLGEKGGPMEMPVLAEAPPSLKDLERWEAMEELEQYEEHVKEASEHPLRVFRVKVTSELEQLSDADAKSWVDECRARDVLRKRLGVIK